MKSKDSPNLYEILRTASRSSTATETAPPPEAPRSPAPAAEPHEPTLQERLAIYKAGKLGLAASAPTAPAAPAPETPAAREDLSAPVPKPPEPALRAEAPPRTEPLTRTEALLSHPAPAAPRTGERVLKVTYNTAAFSALVGLGLLFVAYSLGVRAGRSGSPEAALEAPVPAVQDVAAPAPKPAPVPAPPPSRVYSLRLAEWPYKTAQDRLKANAAADEYKKALTRAGLTGSESISILRGQDPKLALFLGRHADPASASARAAQAAVQKVRIQNQTPFAKAQFEEMPR